MNKANKTFEENMQRLEQIVRAKHYKENVHFLQFREQFDCIGIAWNLSAVGSGIDYLIASTFCK